MPNAITMLKSDHATVKRLLRELNETSAPKQREQLVATIEREVKTHAQIEEEVFYPAFKAAAEKTDNINLFYEAAEEHHLVDIELPSLKTANSKSHEFAAKAKVLKELIEHHIKEEENQMFTAARQLFSEEQLSELGELMQTRKEMIQAMWENPLTRPMKKMQSAVHKMLPTKVKTAKATAIAKAMESRGEAR
jgi:hemerythrin-like domain-containing protein